MTYKEKSRIENEKKFRRADRILWSTLAIGFVILFTGILAIENYIGAGVIFMIIGGVMVGFAGKFIEENEDYCD